MDKFARFVLLLILFPVMYSLPLVGAYFYHCGLELVRAGDGVEVAWSFVLMGSVCLMACFCLLMVIISDMK